MVPRRTPGAQEDAEVRRSGLDAMRRSGGWRRAAECEALSRTGGRRYSEGQRTAGSNVALRSRARALRQRVCAGRARRWGCGWGVGRSAPALCTVSAGRGIAASGRSPLLRRHTMLDPQHARAGFLHKTEHAPAFSRDSKDRKRANEQNFVNNQPREHCMSAHKHREPRHGPHTRHTPATWQTERHTQR